MSEREHIRRELTRVALGEVEDLSGRALASRGHGASTCGAWTDFRIEIEDYRELGERVVALALRRGAGMSSHIEAASAFAVVFAVRNSQILLLDTYDNWKAALEASGLRD